MALSDHDRRTDHVHAYHGGQQRHCALAEILQRHISGSGHPPSEINASGRLSYSHHGARFLVTKPLDGKPATPANGGTISIAAPSPAHAAAWHKAGLENGGTAIENPPGIRQTPVGPMYLAYLRDPDGNKLCVASKVAENV